ncbi:MAG: 30S ribosomal protein S2 [Kiritimatiellia bacterium]
MTVRDLVEAGLHFGHQTKRWNPKMRRYIFTKRNGIHIIDMTTTLVLLQAAQKFVRDLAATGKCVLFVGTKKQAQGIVEETARGCGQPYVTYRWLGGTLTNRETVRNSVRRMRELEAMEQRDGFASVSKKHASSLRRELAKLRRNLAGIVDMNELPGAVFVVDTNREAIAVSEANKLNIPVIAIVDTNSDPDPIDYVIPGNDDALRAIALVVRAIAEAIQDGSKEYSKVAAEIARQKESEAQAAPSQPTQKAELADTSRPAAPRRQPRRPRAAPSPTAKPADKQEGTAAPADPQQEPEPQNVS